MSKPDTVSCAATVRCELSRPLTAACPITDETDYYEVTVTWTTDSRTFEKHALADAIDSYTGVEETQEEIVAGLYDDLLTPGVSGLTVTLKDKKTGLMVRKE